MEEAVRSGNLERVQELIKDGADVNTCCKGIPLLSLAIKVGHTKIALELIDHGANVQAKDSMKGWTALHWACKDKGREEVVQRLVDRGSAVLNEEDFMHITPLSLTTTWCGVAPAHHLLKAGANCKVLSKEKMKVLFLPACWLGNIFVAKSLLDNGCDINSINQYGEGAVTLAVYGGHEEIVKMLILEDANLDLQDLEDGFTALHHAALNDHIQCGVLLVEGGANVGIKDKHSRTALDVARSEEFKEAIKVAQSFTISKIACIVGNTGVGKSTLIAALQAERNSFIGKNFNRFWRVADHRKRTAGIETIHHRSQRYGETLFFDFAGQHEYYGPHQIFLESFLSKPGISMTLLLVVKTTDEKEAILEQLYYWLFPLAQTASSAASPPRVIVIGSFLDHVESKDKAKAMLSSCIEETRKHLNNIMPLEFFHPCLLNCRQPQSEGIDQLCHFLQEVPIPKLTAIHTQYSLAWVLSQIKLAFKEQLAVQLHTLAKWMQENRDNLPQTIPSSEEVCMDLSAAGHALYLPNKDRFHDGWLVLDLAHILHDFYGTLFSQPKENINRFGLLHHKELAQLFPKMCLKMVQQLLITLEFCIPVDPMVLSEDVTKLTANKEDNGWLFFPALVSAKPPKLTSESHSRSRVCSIWWQLKTFKKHFFYARILQTILLHLAAHFVVRHDVHSTGRVQQHCCNFWWHGISWQSKEGVDVTVQITNNRVINVIGISEETADRLCQYLIEVIASIISTIHQVSPNLKADAYIVHRPVRMSVSSEEFATPSCMELFPVADIEASVKECKKYSLSLRDDGDSRSSRVAVSELFKGELPTLEDIRSIRWTLHYPMQLLAEVSSINAPQSVPTHRTSTACSSADLTLTNTGAINLPLSTAESLQSQSLPLSLDALAKPKPNDVGKLIVTPVAANWQIVATWLEVDRCVIEIISRNHRNDCEGACLDMLNRWLQGERHTGEKERTWSTLLTAVGRAGYLDFKQSLQKKHFNTE